MDTTATNIANKALDMLRDLAHQLGTTLEYLWPRYTQYVAAQAVADAVVFGLSCTVLCVLSVLHIKIAVKQTDRSGYGPEAVAEYGWFVAILTGLGTFFTGAVFLTKLGNAIAAGIAPEGYALTQLLSQLK